MANVYFTTMSGTKLTIQQPATGGNEIFMKYAIVYMATAGTVTLIWNADAATATAGTAIPLPGTPLPSLANIFTASNYANGTSGPVYNLGTTSQQIIDLSDYVIGTGRNINNLTLLTSQTATIQLVWSEVTKN